MTRFAAAQDRRAGLRVPPAVTLGLHQDGNTHALYASGGPVTVLPGPFRDAEALRVSAAAQPTKSGSWRGVLRTGDLIVALTHGQELASIVEVTALGPDAPLAPTPGAASGPPAAPASPAH